MLTYRITIAEPKESRLTDEQEEKGGVPKNKIESDLKNALKIIVHTPRQGNEGFSCETLIDMK